MNNCFLKFHDTKNNSVIYINKKDIAVIDTEEDKNQHRFISRIYFVNMNTINVASICVNETVEKVYNAYNLNDVFVKLHRYPTNRAMLVNINIISIIDSTALGNSMVCSDITNLKAFNVYESPDKINSLILEGGKEE